MSWRLGSHSLQHCGCVISPAMSVILRLLQFSVSVQAPACFLDHMPLCAAAWGESLDFFLWYLQALTSVQLPQVWPTLNRGSGVFLPALGMGCGGLSASLLQAQFDVFYSWGCEVPHVLHGAIPLAVLQLTGSVAGVSRGGWPGARVILAGGRYGPLFIMKQSVNLWVGKQLVEGNGST